MAPFWIVAFNLEFSRAIVKKCNKYMGDDSSEQGENSGDTDHTEISIQKEISKLEYYLESADELIQANDVEEIKTTVTQASKITR